MITLTVFKNFSSLEINNTMSSILEQPNVSDSMPCANNTSHHADETHTSKDALFYIITVLMFYACSIVILLVKYVKRERQEAAFTHYYYEFVTREKFQNPIYQNQQHMNKFMRSIKFGCGSKVQPKEFETEGAISKIYVDYHLLHETPV